MAIYQNQVTNLLLSGDGTSTTYSFTPVDYTVAQGLPAVSPGTVFGAQVIGGPTTPTVTVSLLLGVVTLTFSEALQAFDNNPDNNYTVAVTLGY